MTSKIPDEELLKECQITAFRASGPGGQHVNVTDSAIRLKHIPTGIVITSQKERSQYLNKKLCLEKLRAKLTLRAKKRKKRIPTKMSKSVKRENLEKKRKSSLTKQLRKPPKIEE